MANKLNLSWETKDGIQHANYFGSITQSSTLDIGSGKDGKKVYVPFNSLLPMLCPNDITIGGWDISKTNIADSMVSAPNV